MHDLDDRSFASYQAAMQGLANGHDLERRGDVVTRPRLWSIDRSYDSFMNKGRFEFPAGEYAGEAAEPPGGNSPLEVDPLLLSRWAGPGGGTPTVIWNGQTLKIVLQPAAGGAAEPEYLVLLHIDAALVPKVQHLSLKSSFEDGTATLTSEPSFAGGTLRLVDVRDSAVGIQLNQPENPDRVAGLIAEDQRVVGSEFADGEVDPSPDRQQAIILVDGENIGSAVPKHWWRQHASSVADWISDTYNLPAQRVQRTGALCRYENYPPGPGSISAWVVAAARGHGKVEDLSKALVSKGFTRLNNYGPFDAGWSTQTAKDNCDEVLRRVYEDLLDANTALQTTQLVLLNGDGAPSQKGPKGVNCFVWAANAHAGLCQGVPYWQERQTKPVIAVPFDIHNGCNNEWKAKKRSAVKVWPGPFPNEWPDRRRYHVERGRDLLDRVFGTPGQHATLSAATQARLSRFLKDYGWRRGPLCAKGLQEKYDAGEGVPFRGRTISQPVTIRGWVDLTGLPKDAFGPKYGLCARAVLGALREESPLYISRPDLYQDLVQKLQPGWARPAVAIAVACMALGL